MVLRVVEQEDARELYPFNLVKARKQSDSVSEVARAEGKTQIEVEVVADQWVLEEVRDLLEELSRGIDRHPVDVELGGELRAKAGKQGLSANSQGCCEG